MTEFIIRLTDEQVAVVRFFSGLGDPITDAPVAGLLNLNEAVMEQLGAALTLYDQLVAQAQADSDE